MMPQDFAQSSASRVSTEPVMVLAWPMDSRAAEGSHDASFAAAVVLPADTSPSLASSDSSRERALISALTTLTSSLRELTESLQALPSPTSPLNQARSASASAPASPHRAERSTRTRRVPRRGQGPHPGPVARDRGATR